MTQQDASAAIDTSSNVARELDSRTSDGIVVSLLWRPIDDHVSVEVTDTKTGDAFEVEVRPGQRAVDVFNHPYAYATELLAPGPEWRAERMTWSAGGWFLSPSD
jgi:hypothetical protein